MERFKGFFIPLAIPPFEIYIPIWRDLKDRRSAFFKDTQFNLHSNMERFKETGHMTDTAAYQDLHSNMERFKEQA